MAGPSFKLFARIEERVVELDAVAICFRGAADAQKFAEFALSCSDHMLKLGDDYSHEHLAGGQVPDLTIERLAET